LERSDYRGINVFPASFPNFLPAHWAGKKLEEGEKKTALSPGVAGGY
jgi:hypothetical protein